MIIHIWIKRMINQIKFNNQKWKSPNYINQQKLLKCCNADIFFSSYASVFTPLTRVTQTLIENAWLNLMEPQRSRCFEQTSKDLDILEPVVGQCLLGMCPSLNSTFM